MLVLKFTIQITKNVSYEQPSQNTIATAKITRIKTSKTHENDHILRTYKVRESKIIKNKITYHVRNKSQISQVLNKSEL